MAVKMGQYDGDGMWMWGSSSCCSAAASPSPGDFSTSVPAMAGWPSGTSRLTLRPCSSSVYLRCQSSSRLVTSGISLKLYSGGGDGMVHSSVRASQGSSPTISDLRVMKTLMMKMRIERAMTKEPTVDTMFHTSQPLPDG